MMKALTETELDIWVQGWQGLLGAEFQNITWDEKDITLHFWRKGPYKILVRVLSGLPFVFCSSKKEEFGVFPKGRFQKPLAGFIKAHFLKEVVVDVERVSHYGRVLRIHFSAEVEQERFLELRLFSGGANFSAYSGIKQVHLKKPLPLEEVDNSTSPRQARSFKEIQMQSYDHLKKAVKVKTAQSPDKTALAKEKIQKAILELEKDLFFKLAQSLEQGTVLSGELEALWDKKEGTKQEVQNWAYGEHKKKSRQTQKIKGSP